MVRMSTSTGRRSSITASNSSQVFAQPDHEAGLGQRRGSISLAMRKTARLRSGLACGRTHRERRGTVSVLWFRISGCASITSLQRLAIGLEVGDQHLDRAAGLQRCGSRGSCWRRYVRRRRAARRDPRWSARRGAASSRAPTRPRGAARPRPAAAACPILTLQNLHERVQMSPISRKVAVPRPQHSPRLGQNASSQTVCSVWPRISDFSFQYSSFWFSLTRSHSGLRPRRQTGSPGVGVDRACFQRDRINCDVRLFTASLNGWIRASASPLMCESPARARRARLPSAPPTGSGARGPCGRSPRSSAPRCGPAPARAAAR